MVGDGDHSHRSVLSADKYKVCGHFRLCTLRALKTCLRHTGCFILFVAYRADTGADGCVVVLYYIFAD
jgi:hypothetical protein